jgi:hypothetical protein
VLSNSFILFVIYSVHFWNSSSWRSLSNFIRCNSISS